MPLMRLLLATLLLVGACAQAGAPTFGGHPDGSIHVTDSGGGDSQPPPVDAYVRPIDAPPGMMTKTLTETTSDTLVQNTAPACGSSTGTDANSYYRVFDLGANGISTDFHVTKVTFQVDYSTGQTVAVKAGTYNATPGTTLAVANMAVVGTASPAVTVPSTTTGATVNAAFTNTTIPAGARLYVELDSPAGAFFYMGANTGGESAPGYIMASACSINVPTNISTVSTMYPTVNILMTVTGTY